MAIPVRVHWSVLLAAPIGWAFTRDTFGAVAIFVSFILLMLAHELGHALIAKRMGFRVSHVDVYALHGDCHYENFSGPNSIEHYMVSWGGILVQIFLLFIFGSAYAVVITASSRAMDYLAPIIFVFTWLNLLLMVGNALPLPRLDGYYAWRLVRPLLKGELQSRWRRL
jgi:stage IV sporulation protein FB